jgi:hypothetical protein
MLDASSHTGGTDVRNPNFEVTLTNNENDHVFHVAFTRRLNGARNERDAMVAMTRDNMVAHANGGRVVEGPDGRDPEAVLLVLLRTDGTTLVKTVTVRDLRPTPEPDLTDSLLASLVALRG